MEINIRPMKPEEASIVRKIGQKAFTAFESLWVPKPKNALVAVVGEQIAGAALYNIFNAADQKVGYIDYAFIDPDFQNQGIGHQLYNAVIEHLWAQGCDALSAIIKDDNVGSWGLLLKNGFSRVSLPVLVRQFGIDGTLRHYFGTPLFISIGMEYYVALKSQECPSGKKGSIKQICSFMLMNLLLFGVMIAQGNQNIMAFLAAYVLYLAGGILFGYIGTLFSRRKWHFRFANGGFIVCLLVNLWAVYPMVGNWYPDQYENTPSFKRDMGMNALLGWIFVLIFTVISVAGSTDFLLLKYTGQIGWMFLFYRMAPIYPFESFGGRRVYTWNKVIYGVLFIMSAIVIASVYIMY